jgi:hypothetical protein
VNEYARHPLPLVEKENSLIRLRLVLRLNNRSKQGKG